MDYQTKIKLHYSKVWEVEPKIYYFDKGPSNELPHNFRVLEFPPHKNRKMWAYATCCMSQEMDNLGLELHMFSSKKDTEIIELLTIVAHFHRTEHNLGLNHTVNFGRPWQDESKCNFGFISLPFIDGPLLENMQYHSQTIKFYWLIPITKAEVEFKKENGTEALENAFEKANFNYLNPNRRSVI